jgi:flagellar biogenesis protein FliO
LNFDDSSVQGTFAPLPGNSIQGAKPAVEKPVQPLPGLELSGTLKKIILNTILVLAVAVTFIYIATKTRRNGVIPGGKPRSNIAIEQTLSLGNKAVLKIVRIGEQQVLIAMDATGVKSVVSLQEPFLNGLEANEISEAPKLKQPEPVLNATEQLLAKQLEQFDPEFKKWLLMHQTLKTAS